MSKHELDLPVFRQMFPAFSDISLFSDAYIELQWDAAVAHMGDNDGWALSGPTLQLALNYMTAHLMALNLVISQGGGGAVGAVQSATIDKVTVTMATIPARSGWQVWLSSTPYGLQLWALLSLRSAGGLYIGGRPERAAFRKVGGLF